MAGLIGHIRMTLETLDPNDDNPSVSVTFESGDGAFFTNFAPVAADIVGLFNALGGTQVHPLAYYINDSISRAANACLLEAYDVTAHLNGTPAGSPAFVTNWTLGASSGAPSLPTGVAATVSYRKEYGTDVEFGTGSRPRARDRGRFYLGPLNFATVENALDTARCHLTPGFIADCLQAALRLSAVTFTDGAAIDWEWVQWSRKNAAVNFPVTAWMDDRPDYQRRRSDPTPATKQSILLGAP